ASPKNSAAISSAPFGRRAGHFLRAYLPQTGCLAVPKTWGVDDVSHRVSESKRGYLIRGEQMDETLFYILVNLNTYGKYSV
ncbi:MAG: hypothetical protein KAR17_23170, partial [Cyclobacteriaceae bacterium]|nr:hypothetical protein [Cyclobacteriaceae bacterium]